MEKTIEGLREQKMELLQKLADIGNFRRGTLSVNYRIQNERLVLTIGIRGALYFLHS